jgi:hypothetical protein
VLLKTNLIPELNPALGLALGLSIESDGNVYLGCQNGTTEYNSAGKCVEPIQPITTPEECALISAGTGLSVALDSTGDIFVSDATSLAVLEYGPGEKHLLIPNPSLEVGAFATFPIGLAINDTSHILYVAENEGVVKVFKFLDVKPVIVKTEEAKQISGPVEALNGKVNPGGQEPAEYYFEYGTSPCLPETCGTVATEPSQVPLNGDEEIPVSVRLDNLAPNTTYHYRIVGVNEESGVEYGGEQTFTTGGPAPSPPAPAPEGAAPESKTPASSTAYPLLTGIKPVPMPPVPIKKKLTRAQQLAKALATCNRKPKKQRAGCKRQARKKYGPVTKGVAKKRRK